MKRTIFSTILVMLVVFSGLCPAATSSNKCYDAEKIQLILRFSNSKKALPFSTYDEWVSIGQDPATLNNKFTWFIRTGAGKQLDDAELLDYLGREKDAEKMREHYDSAKKKATGQFILGLPLGLGMLGGGAWWLNRSLDVKDPPPYEKAGAILMIAGGIGISAGVILHFIRSRKRAPTDHELTALQSLEMADRYNRTLLLNCENKAKEN